MPDDQTPPTESPQTPVSDGLPTAPIEPVSEPTPEALASAPSEPAEPVSEPVLEPAAEPQSEPPTSEPRPQTQPAASAAQPASVNTALQAARGLLVKARAKIQTKKQLRLERIMTLSEKKKEITNDDVDKLLHCSDATARRYLNELVKQGNIKRIGTTGAGVKYVKA